MRGRYYLRVEGRKEYFDYGNRLYICAFDFPFTESNEATIRKALFDLANGLTIDGAEAWTVTRQVEG